jgi:hypothetical protein
MDFSLVTEGEASEGDQIIEFSSVTKGVGLRVRDGGFWMDVLFLGIRVVTEIR